ncbi:hypothetical protein B0T24DRAFT_692529 [Lasiosphaeria ovina]|uniref:Uncharacterized protein n=1 Tax=Lasiosphaeria ovina TaxID=92902 RepID=A0AAE0JT21_9PEZI|nr:hypothetical protein B0T24DRAFT_692529 [Lasiosphaeria ovina]
MATNSPYSSDLESIDNIFLDPPLTAADNNSWPENCRATLRHIRQLGQVAIEQYQENTNINSLFNPWNQQARQRATHIAAVAEKCLMQEDSANRDKYWKRIRESILARLTTEVIWRCTKPIFGSEEVNPTAYREEFQQMFGASALPSVTCNVYGLRDTDEIGKKMGLEAASSNSSESGPNAVPIMFPFLAVQNASTSESNRQTVFEGMAPLIMRNLLSLQQNLQDTVHTVTDWEAAPLTWLIVHHAQEWEVIFPIWNGAVNSTQAALQLVLIVDYIVDWAREIYRHDVMRTFNLLKELTRGPSTPSPNALPSNVGKNPGVSEVDMNETSKAVPTDNAPAPRPTNDTLLPQEAPNSSNSLGRSQQTPVEDAMRAFDCPFGVIRDVRYVRSRFIGVYVTEDNLRVLLNTAVSPEETQKLAVNILNCLKKAWRVRRDALDVVEEKWTGKDRAGSDAYSPDKIFLAVFTAAAYISPDWEPTRDLTYLAVAESVMDSLLEVAGLHRFPRELADAHPLVPTESVRWSVCVGFKLSGTEETFLACMARICVETGITPVSSKRGAKDPDKETDMVAFRLYNSEEREGEVLFRMDVVTEYQTSPKGRNAVLDIYKRHKVGRNEPWSSLFRVSDTLDQLWLPEEVRKLARHGNLIHPSLWYPDLVLPSYQGQSYVLATPAPDSPRFPGQADLCVFVINATAMLQEGIQPDALLEAKADFCLKAHRVDRLSGGRRGWYKIKEDDFISHDIGAAAANLDAFVSQFRTAAAAAATREQSDDSSSDALPIKFWRPKGVGGIMYMVDTEIDNDKPRRDCGLAREFVNAMPHGNRINRFSSITPFREQSPVEG